MSNAGSGTGSWFSGTLDVISGRVTPTGTPKRRPGHVRSASTGGVIQRLPSQDSLDRSIHNDSGHGKSTAQIIRDLRASNARLTAQTAQMEASFMNQMAQTSARLEVEIVNLKGELGEKEQSMQSLETRVQTHESIMAEKDAMITKFKEDSAYQRHTISELRSQLSESESRDAQQSREVDDGLRKNAGSHALGSDGGDSQHGSVWKQLERTQDELRQAGERMQQFQEEQKTLVAEHERKVSSLRKQVSDSEAFSEVQAEVESRDQQIQDLHKSNALQQNEVAELKEKIQKMEQSYKVQEGYRRDEAEDLRVLNDAQEEENEKLKKQLDDAMQQIDLRDQELEEMKTSSKKIIEQSTTDLEDTIKALRSDLDEARLSATQDSHSVVAELRAELEKSQTEKEELETLHGQELGRLQKMVTQAKSEFSRELNEKQMELEKLAKLSSRSSESPTDVAKLQAQLKEYQLQVETANIRPKQSSGSFEAELQKDLEKAHETEKQLADQLESVMTDKENELQEVREKLSDRDTTISSLVKASVALEQKLAAANVETNELRAKVQGNESGTRGITNPHETEKLRSSLTKYKEIEDRLSKEVFRLKRQLRQASEENDRLQSQVEQRRNEETNSVDMSTGSSTRSNARMLKERDEAIAKLVQQSMSQERTVAELREQVLTLSHELDIARSATQTRGSPTWDEIQQLRQETEMFAGQVIEQDEEIESLRQTLDEKQEEIKDLQEQLASMKDRPAVKEGDKQRIRFLEAELDELREARDEQMQELRVLRRTAREFEMSADRIAEARGETREAQESAEEYKRMVDSFSREKAALFQELEQERSSRAQAEEKLQVSKKAEKDLNEVQSILTSQNISIDDLKEGAFGSRNKDRGFDEQVDEMEVTGLRNEKENLERNLANQSAALDKSKETIRELEHMLAEKSSSESAAFEHEKEEFLHEIEALTQQLDNARDELESLEAEKHLIEEFKSKLEQADEARESSEKTIVDTYERKLSLLTLDKDVTIDKLRKELVETKEITEQEVQQAQLDVQQYQAQIEELKEDAAAQLEQRETQIFALEHTLGAQEQLVNNMKTEMDHLQGSMVNTTVGRREEIEEMQQELTDMTTENAKQEREIKSLKMKIEERQLAHKTDVTKLKESMHSLEKTANDSSHHRNAADLQMELRVQEVKDRLEKLKFRNQTLQEENERLRQYLEKAQEKLRGEGREDEERLREELDTQTKRVTALHLELEALQSSTERVKELEAELKTYTEATASKTSKKSRRGFLGKKK